MTTQKKPAQARRDTAGKRIKVTLVKGTTATKQTHRATVKGLGLKHRSHTVEVEDTPAIRGMINRVSYLVKVEE
jgi:large subunit ribosomal protein L30